MTTRQPVWKLVGNLGDATPMEYGGYFIYQDETGVYEEEGELYDADTRILYRFLLERLYQLPGVGLVNARLAAHAADLPYPIDSYVEWFDDNLIAVADFGGMLEQELRDQFCSVNPLERAQAYLLLGEYHGFENLDSYPLKLTKREAAKRGKKWQAELDALKKE